MKFEDLLKHEEAKRKMQWLVFNQTKLDNYVVLFENFDKLFIGSALKEEFGIDCLDSCGAASHDRFTGFLITEEDANLLRLMKIEKMALCVDVKTIIDCYDKGQ